MDSNFPDSVLARVRRVVQDSLPCQAAPVQMALATLLTEDAEPLRAMIACSLHDGEAAVQVGAALDLIDIGLRRLHARVEDPGDMTALLGTAGNVLAGDYLTSGSFKLLVRSGDMAMLTRIADAITRTCELVIQEHVDAAAGRLPDAAAAPAPLGEVAGHCIALLAGHGEDVALTAARMGGRLAACQVLARRARREPALDATAAKAMLAEAARLCDDAMLQAEALHAAIGNTRALTLTRWMRERIAAAAVRLDPS